jgi:hypothetical protein
VEFLWTPERSAGASLTYSPRQGWAPSCIIRHYRPGIAALKVVARALPSSQAVAASIFENVGLGSLGH